MMHWGFLMPQVSKKTGKPILPKAVNNVRDDRLRASPFWRESFDRRRCLIPGTAFCEAKGKSPATYYWFGIKGDEEKTPFAFAGIWRNFKGRYRDELVEIETYSMVTTTPNAVVSPIHPDRMPAILEEGDHDTWLGGSPDDAFATIKPYPAERMQIIETT
jgi:putative SOS response-associated peptidase YedK